MHTCPCCSAPLLRHVRHNSIYWYCSHCRQEMPNLESIRGSNQKQSIESWLNIRGETPSLVGLSLVEIVESVQQKVPA
jgi:hypothetical protein